MATYQIRFEHEDGTLLDPLDAVYTNKAKAIRIARFLAKSSSFQCVKIWVDDTIQDLGVWHANLPAWEA
jgi:hypothetical protein